MNTHVFYELVRDQDDNYMVVPRKFIAVAQSIIGGRIYKDLDTGELSPEVNNGKELQAWYNNRPIFQAIF